MEEAEEYILAEDYNEALSVLNDLMIKGFENSNVHFKIGFCYLNSVSEKNMALSYLKKAALNISKQYNPENLLEENAPIEAMLYLGDAYRQSNRISEALKCYKQYAGLVGTNNSTALETAEKRIKECHIAKVLQSRPVPVKWEQLGVSINQGIANLNPVLSADGKTLIFTRKMKFYDAIYITHQSSNEWEEPVNITTQLGSDGEFYPTSLSYDGKKILLSSYEMLSGQDIYESEWNGSRWSKLKKLDEGVNSKFAEINASYSPDGNTIFFASNRENGFGGFDIYKSTRRADNSWSHAINLGASVNTKADEKTPILFQNGSTLAFSSQGHLNMGGMDLFYVDYPIESDSKVKNFGSPYNTVNNDFSFYPIPDTNIAYVAKYHTDGQGETDIFKTEYTSLSNFYEVNVKTIMNISGIKEEDSISLCLIDALLKDTIEQRSSTKAGISNNYLLYPGNFILIAEATDMKPDTASFEIPENTKEKIYQVPLSIYFEAYGQENKPNIQTPENLLIKNITFGFDSHALEKEYLPLLDEIAEYLVNNQMVNVKITGYADSIGNLQYNQDLSKKRANQVYEYFLKKNVSPQRMKVIGEGNRNFIAINTNPDGTDSPEGRQLNRRVELNLENNPENINIIKENNIPEKLKIK